ncbi:MAG: squalene--hopene cyclase [Planctomycetes bacterium]|nr:squalene--hopene cyclase [Planctomycetota bacterium]
MQAASIAVAVLALLAGAGVTTLVRTRWLQSRTLEKCVGLSVILHLALMVVAAFVGRWSPSSWGRLDEGRMTMMVVLAEDDVADVAVADAAPAIGDPHDSIDEPAAEAAAAIAPEAPTLVALDAAQALPVPPDLVPLLDPPAERPRDDAVAEPPLSDAAAAGGPDCRAAGEGHAVEAPEAYADRIGARRAAAAAARGGSAETEHAVQTALAWLAGAQSSDGRWNAAAYGAGRGRAGAAQHAAQVGGRSDHGVTALALLAYLGAGNTHREGPYADQVARGIGFLAERQRPDGSLAGDADFFAALYCHGMATIAVGECAAMSGDESLARVLERAVRHTVAMQHPVTGGWRYAAGDRGDTSQLGWQVMALAAAKNVGLDGLDAAQGRARGFLLSVSSGAAGGLASYRRGERPNVTMTAEALVCRLLLGMPADHPATAEALGLLSQSPPSSSTYNIYTWYYATLASFHAGGPQWEAWNRRLQAALLPLQHRAGGPLDGSWDPDTVWGGHGGRVYATALAALTLEVYYRYLPMHGRLARMAAAP